MTSIKKDGRPFIIRFWEFQSKRMPLFAMMITALLAMGVVYNFSHAPLRNYLTASAIFILYLIQIRTADEKKDFEHDNQFHKDRPVQRGVISLDELQIINRLAVLIQLVLYASFGDLNILLLGFLSQGYAMLTRKEFFVRGWIRKHFFVYYFSHYIQLVILFYALVSIIKPTVVSYIHLVIFAMLGVVMSELGRKMYPMEEDTTDDTYSAQLGHRGAAITISIIALLAELYVVYFISSRGQKYFFAIFPMIALAYLIYRAYRYAVSPHHSEAKHIENAASIMVLIAMICIILGA